MSEGRRRVPCITRRLAIRLTISTAMTHSSRDYELNSAPFSGDRSIVCSVSSLRNFHSPVGSPDRILGDLRILSLMLLRFLFVDLECSPVSPSQTKVSESLGDWVLVNGFPSL